MTKCVVDPFAYWISIEIKVRLPSAATRYLSCSVDVSMLDALYVFEIKFAMAVVEVSASIT